MAMPPVRLASLAQGRTFAKLNLKDQKEIVVLNAPASFEPELKSLKGVTVRRDLKGGDIDFSLAFVTTQKEVDTLGAQIGKKAKGDAIVWFAIRKDRRRSTRARSIATVAGRSWGRRASSRYG
jgi:hypothetical protein